MRNIKNITLRIAAAAVLCTTTVLSCKEEQVIKTDEKSVSLNENKSQVTDSASVSIETLKKYFSVRINAPVNEISYDEKTEQFVFRGVNQMSRKDMVESYLANTSK